MKVKLDFVTNSSSTVYILYIPSTYKIEDDLDKVIDEYWNELDNDFNSIEEYRTTILADFIDLKENGYLHMEDYYYTIGPIREVLVDKKKFDLFQIDVGPDNEQLHNVTLDKLKDKMKDAFAIEELVKMKGDLNGTEITKH